MKILVISDFHGASQYLQPLKNVISKKNLDLVIFCGDVVRGSARGSEWLSGVRNKTTHAIILEEKEDLEIYETFYTFFEQFSLPVLTVPGNMDAPEERYFRATLNRKSNIYLIHQNMFIRDNVIFFGYGGEITDIYENYFVLQYPAEHFELSLKKYAYYECEKILVTHTPPVAKIGKEGAFVLGKEIVNKIINEVKPKLLLCGHAHKSQGIDRINETICINPGPIKYGNCVIVDSNTLDVVFEKL